MENFRKFCALLTTLTMASLMIIFVSACAITYTGYAGISVFWLIAGFLGWLIDRNPTIFTWRKRDEALFATIAAIGGIITLLSVIKTRIYSKT